MWDKFLPLSINQNEFVSMKKLFLIAVSVLFTTSLLAQDAEVIRLSDPVQETEQFEVFGAELNYESLSPATLSDIIESESENTVVTLKASVAEVCSKKGCFFIAEDGDYQARITFKDYGFFIPTDSKGKEVIFVGDFTVKTLSEEKAKHYAEDAGKDPETVKGSQKEYSVVATSVIVPKTK